jgi:hypothetical protein
MPRTPQPFVTDALGGTLARDHQSRGLFFRGRFARTYVAYMDHHFNARMTCYDHDAGQWSFPARIDTCIRNPHPDGHNVPNLFVSGDGFLHVLYGAHNDSFKYARSREPENPDAWETGGRVGAQATYPYVARTADGELLLFYRHGPTGGYNNPFLAVHHSVDNGRTWGELRRLATFTEGCKLYGNNALYDPLRRRVHLVLNVPLEAGRRLEKRAWTQYYCQYDPESGTLHGVTGEPVGPLAQEEDFRRHNGPLAGREIVDMALHERTLLFLLRSGDDGLEVGRWDGSDLACAGIPAGLLPHGALGQATLGTEDGRRLDLYGISAEGPDAGDLMRWRSEDGGATWREGECLLRHPTPGNHLQSPNLVMGYPGAGPRLLVGERPGPWPPDVQRTPANHYDNPRRRDKRLYALDADGQTLPAAEAPA